jgi:hypothetical protein
MHYATLRYAVAERRRLLPFDTPFFDRTVAAQSEDSSMVRLAIAACVALLPIAASAQTASPAPHGMTREQFVQRGAEMAGRRFDEIDTGHTGTITRDQIRAWRQSHAGQAGAQRANAE